MKFNRGSWLGASLALLAASSVAHAQDGAQGETTKVGENEGWTTSGQGQQGWSTTGQGQQQGSTSGMGGMTGMGGMGGMAGQCPGCGAMRQQARLGWQRMQLGGSGGQGLYGQQGGMYGQQGLYGQQGGMYGQQGLYGQTGYGGGQGMYGAGGFFGGGQGPYGQPGGFGGGQGMYGAGGFGGGQGLYGQTGGYGQQGLYGPTGGYGQQGLYGQTGGYGQQGLYGQTGGYGQQGLYGQTGGFGGTGYNASFGGGAGQGGAGWAGTSTVGQIQGVVHGLNFARGVIVVSTQQGMVKLRATPGQLSQLNPGDAVTIPYGNFGGNLWAVPYSGQSIAQTGGPGTFAQAGMITGAITALDTGRGVICIQGHPMRAHPQVLQNVAPGQLVQVQFEQVQGMPWVVNVMPVGQGGGTIGGGGGGFGY